MPELVLSGEKIRTTLALANEFALTNQIDRSSELIMDWSAKIESLSAPSMPKTYLAVFGVLLVARSLEQKDKLDVRHIKAGKSPLGYSAPSIGKALATFAKEQGIDLRATSSQPMNNNPFTFKDFIDEKIQVQRNKLPQWKVFYSLAGMINELTSEAAREVLSLLFDMRRVQAKPVVVAHGKQSDLFAAERFMEEICQFVEKNSENGKVGQAFVSACLELVYGQENVSQGHSQDPDARLAGDVHVGKKDAPTIFVEVKQVPIATGQISGFLDKISATGADRAFYFALENHKYSGHINLETIRKKTQKLNLTLMVFNSPQEVFDVLFAQMLCSVGDFIEEFSITFRSRLAEAGVAEMLMSLYEHNVSDYVSFTSAK